MQVVMESASEVRGFIVTEDKPTWVIGLTKMVQDRGLAELRRPGFTPVKPGEKYSPKTTQNDYQERGNQL
jgi:hypothetical protein